MDKKRWLHIAEWVIALAACGYLIWKMATYDDYASLGECLRNMGWQQWCAIVLCVALMPVNMGIEAWRWRTLMNGVECKVYGVQLSFREAQRQVYYSKLAGLITPWRLGEYPSRALLMERTIDNGQWIMDKTLWPRVLSMGAVGSATMTTAIVATGVIAMIMDKGQWTMDGIQWTMGNGQYWIYVGAVILLLILFLALAPRILRRWAEVSHKLVLVSVGQSMVRLLCWCVQLYLVLFSLGGLGTLGVLGNLGACAVYYLLVTITPNVPIVEAGVRGAWAIFVFGTMNAALAGVLLWAINTLFPCIMWLFFRKK